MNWLLVVVLVILAGHTIKGYRRGLLRVLFSVASLLREYENLSKS